MNFTATKSIADGKKYMRSARAQTGRRPLMIPYRNPDGMVSTPNDLIIESKFASEVTKVTGTAQNKIPVDHKSAAWNFITSSLFFGKGTFSQMIPSGSGAGITSIQSTLPLISHWTADCLATRLVNVTKAVGAVEISSISSVGNVLKICGVVPKVGGLALCGSRGRSIFEVASSSLLKTRLHVLLCSVTSCSPGKSFTHSCSSHLFSPLARRGVEGDIFGESRGSELGVETGNTSLISCATPIFSVPEANLCKARRSSSTAIFNRSTSCR
mmetsp:Transcript_45809/g.67616  ORF Transcript_45809/g.67616 Transcript_45809/m.67616 type:complete len:270 (+) Transcript_45809:1329-2138(+)